MSENRADSLISQCTHTPSQASYDALFEALYGTEVFFNFAKDASGKGQLTTYIVGPLQHVVKFYTSRTNRNLVEPYAGLQWAAGLEMFQKMPAADGLLVMNAQEDYVVFNRSAVQAGLARRGRGTT